MNVSNGTSTCDGEQYRVKLHTLKSIHNCRSYGLDKFRCTHIHQTVVVTTFSCSPTAGLTKMIEKESTETAGCWTLIPCKSFLLKLGVR